MSDQPRGMLSHFMATPIDSQCRKELYPDETVVQVRMNFKTREQAMKFYRDVMNNYVEHGGEYQ